MSDKYVLRGKKAVPCDDLIEWSRRFEKGDERRVAETNLKDCRVSTVFLGLDHQFDPGGPPLIFETMIFGGPHDGYQDRYTTWEEAEAGHAKAVELARQPLASDEEPG